MEGVSRGLSNAVRHHGEEKEEEEEKIRSNVPYLSKKYIMQNAYVYAVKNNTD
jgi:hypothetical protein